MKAKIHSIQSTSNSQFNASVTVFDDKGVELFQQVVGFNLVESDPSKAIQYIKDAVSARAKQKVAEDASVAVPEIQKIIGQEFDI